MLMKLVSSDSCDDSSNPVLIQNATFFETSSTKLPWFFQVQGALGLQKCMHATTNQKIGPTGPKQQHLGGGSVDGESVRMGTKGCWVSHIFPRKSDGSCFGGVCPNIAMFVQVRDKMSCFFNVVSVSNMFAKVCPANC